MSKQDVRTPFFLKMSERDSIAKEVFKTLKPKWPQTDAETVDESINFGLAIAYKDMQAGKPITNLNGYVYRVADWDLRRQRRLAYQQRELSSESMESIVGSLCSEEPSPQQALETREMWERLARDVLELDESIRVPLVARIIHDMPYEEIARICGLAVGTVRNNVSKGLRRIKQMQENREMMEKA